MNEPLVIETLILIGASVISIALLSRLNLPAVLGYLFAGVVIGPLGFGLVTASEGPRFLADLGLVLLMFMVGLEFSWAEMWATRRAVFVAGALQVLLNMAAATLVGHTLGMPWEAATLAGGAAAMCSTGISLKQLKERGEFARPHGRMATGVLLFQDIATLPLLVVIDSAKNTGTIALMPALQQLAVAAGSLGGLLWVGRPMLRRVLGWVGRRKSLDLFLLSALLLALGTAYIAQRLHAAPTIGAFLAGVAVGESDLRHRISDQLAPFRDMLLGLFFVTVGMQVDPAAVTASPLQALLWLGLFVLVKPLLGLMVLRTTGYGLIDSLRAATVLAHASELTLLIVTQSVSAGLVPAGPAQAMLVAAAVSMGLAPLIIHHNREVATRLLRSLEGLTRHSRMVPVDVDHGAHGAQTPGSPQK